MAFFIIRGTFTDDLKNFIPLGVLANDGSNLIYMDIPNGCKKTNFKIKAVEKLKLKYKNKSYTYKDDPELFLKLLIQYYAGFLSSKEEFHPLYIGSYKGDAEEVARKVSEKLGLFDKKGVATEELIKLFTGAD